MKFCISTIALVIFALTQSLFVSASTTGYICQGDADIIRCPGELVIDIVYADFGREVSTFRCGNRKSLNYTCFNSVKNITKERCNCEKDCLVQAKNRLVPREVRCLGGNKYLQLQFSCINKAECSKENTPSQNGNNPSTTQFYTDDSTTTQSSSPQVHTANPFNGEGYTSNLLHSTTYLIEADNALPVPWIVNGVLVLALALIIALICIWRKKTGKKNINPVKRLSKKIRPNNYSLRKRHSKSATIDKEFEASTKLSKPTMGKKNSFNKKGFYIYDEIPNRVEESRVYSMASDVKNPQNIYENQTQFQSNVLTHNESPYVIMEPQNEFYKKQKSAQFG